MNATPESTGRHSSGRESAVLAALDGIPEIYRLPLWLRFCLGFEASETARALAIEENSLPGLLAAGLHQLARNMGVTSPGLEASSLPRILAGGGGVKAPPSLRRRISAIVALAALPSLPVLRVPGNLSLGQYGVIHHN